MKFISLCFFTVVFCINTYGQKGLLRIKISDVPSQLSADVSITGPNGFVKDLRQSETLSNLESGTYEIKSTILIVREQAISKAYRPEKLVRKITVKNDTSAVSIVYQLMPGSDKLWIGNQNAVMKSSTRIVGFSDENLVTSSNGNATVKLTDKATQPNAIAFDQNGNLWLADAYTIKMYEWSSLNKTNVLPVVILTAQHPVSCLAFDSQGNLWVGDSKKIGSISRIPAAKLVKTGTAIVDVVLTGPAFVGVQNLAFDKNDNLWMATMTKDVVVKLASTVLQKSFNSVIAEVEITCQSKPPVTSVLSAPKTIAFDKQGNLWVGFFGPNVIAMIPTSQLGTTATLKPDIQITLSGGVLIHQLAFDESGALWTALASGKFGKLNTEQLSSSGKKVPDLVVASPDLKYATGLAFYPIPDGLSIH